MTPHRTDWVLITVASWVAVCRGDNGLTKLTNPGSRNGLKVTIGTPRSRGRSNVRKRIVPSHPLLAIGAPVPFERLGQASLAFQIQITP